MWLCTHWVHIRCYIFSSRFLYFCNASYYNLWDLIEHIYRNRDFMRLNMHTDARTHKHTHRITSHRTNYNWRWSLKLKRKKNHFNSLLHQWSKYLHCNVTLCDLFGMSREKNTEKNCNCNFSLGKTMTIDR